MMASAGNTTNTNATVPIDNECDKDTNIRLLLTKIDALEQMKGEVGETLLDVVNKRIAYPTMITSYAAEVGKLRMKRMEEAELVWQTKPAVKKDVEKMLEMIYQVKEVDKENNLLAHRLFELKRQSEELEKSAKMNDEIVRSMIIY